jgi:type II secretory pathway component GspD/PulD (secretin)
VKTVLKYLTPLALAFPLLAKDPTNAPANPATPAATPPAPGATTPPNRALPRPITAAPAAPGGAVPAAVPAPGAPAPAAQPTVPAPGAPARPTVPGAPAANQATPVVPGINPPAGAGAARPGVAGAPAPGAAGAAGANQPGAAAAKNPAEEVFPAGLIKFQDADLSQVLEIYQELTGRTILKPASLPQVKISIRTQTELTRSEAIQALDSILSLNGITMVPQGDPVKGKFIKALAEGQAGTAGQQLNDLPHELLPDSGTYVTHVVQLTNASPNDIIQVLQPFAKAPNSILTIPSTGMLVLRDYAENVKRMLEMIAKVDVVPQQEFESVVIPIKYALAGDIATVLGNLTAGGGSATTIGGQGQGGGGRGLSGGLGGGGVGGAGGLGGRGGFGGQGIPGQPGYNPNALNQGGLGGAGGVGGAGGRNSFQNRLQQIVNRATTGNSSGDIFVLGQTKIIADERINALLIFASKADLHTISNIIEKLDVVLSQVLIEAIVMEVSLGNDLNYGFSYLQRQPGSKIGDIANGIGGLKNVPFLNSDNFGSLATNAAGALPSGFSYFAQFMDFDATAVAAASDSRVNVISRPRIQTSHAVEAQLFVGNTRPYVSGQYSYFGGGPQTQFQQQQIGISLSVLPLINAEGLVVMDISTKIQQIGEEIPIDANFKVPETIDREATAKVAVRDRETIMLGGFISTTKTKSKSGIPILKDIPILGNLFSSVKDSDQRKELILLLRPTVLPTPQDAATFASEERARLPGTRRADKEFIESEKKLLDDENRRSTKEARKLYKKEGFSE